MQDEPTSEVDANDEAAVKRNPLLLFLREIAIVVSVAVVISFLVKTFLAQPFWIPSGSMNDTLIRGDRVVVSKLTPGPFDLDRGDVIVFEDPGGWLPQVPQDRGPLLKGLEFVGLYPAGDNHLIKRVIGLPGDKVACCDKQGRMTVNGVPIEEPYLHRGDGPSDQKFSITVPAGKVWVMGDHRSNSSDSRFHDNGTGKTGSVPIDKVTGRARTVVWPLDRWDWLDDQKKTFEKVGAS
ncbi:signal peptidase I [Demetria terragena]|uniref:signal peptidase I n=1 Tax=Demetria terragena TaxID=63959 RepID=UPI00036E77E7|nr:signal peptidase I [Demetria terragena]